MLDSDIDSLLDIASPDLFVNDDTKSALGNIINDTSLSVVNLERHSVIELLVAFLLVAVPVVALLSLPLLNRTVRLDIYNVANT